MARTNSIKNKPLTDVQKGVILSGFKKKLSPEQLINDAVLKRSDGSKILKQTVEYWYKRIRETGTIEIKKRSGRPRKLNEEKEKKLCDFVLKNNRLSYREVKIKTNAPCSIRTVNDYCLKNKISKFFSFFFIC